MVGKELIKGTASWEGGARQGKLLKSYAPDFGVRFEPRNEETLYGKENPAGFEMGRQLPKKESSSMPAYTAARTKQQEGDPRCLWGGPLRGGGVGGGYGGAINLNYKGY